MPELPDVEVFRRYFDETARHQTMENVSADRSILEDASVEQLSDILTGNAFERSMRHGKHLFTGVSNGMWVAFHFGMTGFLKYYSEENQQPGHMRMRISFSNGNYLAYDSMRKLGRIRVTDNPGTFIRDSGLGPDAIAGEMTLEKFRDRLSTIRGSAKTALMNQSVIAGIGNIYSDEILFHAQIHPKRISAI